MRLIQYSVHSREETMKDRVGLLQAGNWLQDQTAAQPTWRFTGSYKWDYKSPNMGDSYSYPTESSTYNYPCTSKYGMGQSQVARLTSRGNEAKAGKCQERSGFSRAPMAEGPRSSLSSKERFRV